MTHQRRTYTRRELLDLPATVSPEVAFDVLDVGRTKGYALLREGRLPVRVLTLGSTYRIPSADLLDAVGIPVPERRAPVAAVPDESGGAA